VTDIKTEYSIELFHIHPPDMFLLDDSEVEGGRSDHRKVSPCGCVYGQPETVTEVQKRLEVTGPS